MKSFHRMTVAMRASLDRVLTQVQNHEAVTHSALEELRGHLARARSHQSRVQRDGQALQRELDKAQAAHRAWRTRAITTGDQGAAIECMRRSKQAEAHAKRLDSRRREHAQVTRRLDGEIRTLEERYQDLHTRKRVLQARDAEARALEVTEGGVQYLGEDVEQLLERWEMTLDERCYQVPYREEDDFEIGFIEAEEQAELVAELERLRGEK